MNRSNVLAAGASRACLLLLCVAAMSGCDAPMPPNMVLQEYHTPATGPFLATGWTDANGKPVSADDELAAKTRCAQRIVEASTDQIHNVPARDIDDCLLRMGWKKGAK
jgi:hypothetical protein